MLLLTPQDFMDAKINTAMQYQMQSYPRKPEIPGTTTKRHPNDTPTTPLSIHTYHLKKKKDAKEMELATTAAR